MKYKLSILINSLKNQPDRFISIFRLKKLEISIISCLILLFLILSFTSLSQKSATFDEGAHIPAAYTYVAYGDFRLNPEHPPLSKLLAGWAQILMSPKADINDASWQKGNQWEFGAKYLYTWNDADKIIFVSRIPGVLLAALFGLLICFASRQLYGWKAGCLALTFWVFSPDVLAHAQLVTSDLPVAGFLFLGVWRYFNTLRKITVLNVIWLGISVGFCLVSKFSGVLIFFMLGLVGLAYTFSKENILLRMLNNSAERRLTGFVEKAVAAFALIFAAGLLSLVVVWSSYGFNSKLSHSSEINSRMNWQHYWEKKSLATTVLHIPYSLRILPDGYIFGFLVMLESAEMRQAFLMGDLSVKGWWYYFIITFFVKTQIPLLLFIGLAFSSLVRYREGLAIEAMLLLPMCLFFFIAMSAQLNIGHRHILPIYPFLMILASKISRDFSWPKLNGITILSLVLLSWSLLGTLLQYPHFLSYFNEIAGGSKNGYLYLIDSNIDWGQDLKELAKYRKEHPEGELYLSYFGTASPQYYGIKAEMLPGFTLPLTQKMLEGTFIPFEQIPAGSVVAISVSNLTGPYMWMAHIKGTDKFLQHLQRLEPFARIGYSINLYRLP